MVPIGGRHAHEDEFTRCTHLAGSVSDYERDIGKHLTFRSAFSKDAARVELCDIDAVLGFAGQISRCVARVGVENGLFVRAVESRGRVSVFGKPLPGCRGGRLGDGFVFTDSCLEEIKDVHAFIVPPRVYPVPIDRLNGRPLLRDGELGGNYTSFKTDLGTLVGVV